MRESGEKGIFLLIRRQMPFRRRASSWESSLREAEVAPPGAEPRSEDRGPGTPPHRGSVPPGHPKGSARCGSAAGGETGNGRDAPRGGRNRSSAEAAGGT